MSFFQSLKPSTRKANMDTSIQELFDRLKEHDKKPLPSVNPTPDADLLELDNDDDRQVIFEEINKNLQSLPKLENDFDKLTHSKKQPETISKSTKIDTNNTNTSSDDWFLLPKPDRATLDKAKRDLLLLKHRAALDPKRHYKKDRWQIPERFAIGTIIEDKSEFYSSRLTNKQRKNTILETLMHDQESMGYFKRKYSQIQQAKTSGRKAHYRGVKAMRRSKK